MHRPRWGVALLSVTLIATAASVASGGGALAAAAKSFKSSFETAKLVANAHALVDSVVKAKPPAAKGKYLKSVTVSSTMGPGVRIDTTAVETVAH